MSNKSDSHHESRRDKEKKKHFRDRSKEKRQTKEESEKYAPTTPIILGKSSKSAASANQEPTPTLLASPSAKSFESQSHVESLSTSKLIDCLEFIQETQKIFSDNNTEYSVIGIIGNLCDNQLKSKIVSVLQGNSFYSLSGNDDDSTTYGITVSIVLLERLIVLQYHEKSQFVVPNQREGLLLGAFLFCVCDVILVGQMQVVDLAVCTFLKEIDNLKRSTQLFLQASSIKINDPQLVFLFCDLTEDNTGRCCGNRLRKDLESAFFKSLQVPQLQSDNSRIFTFPTETEDCSCEDPVSDFRDTVLSLCALMRQQRHHSAITSEREWFRNCSQIWESIKHSIS